MPSSVTRALTSVAQGLYAVSADQLMPLGTTLQLGDGREFVYAEVGGVAAVNGRLYAAEAVVADHGGTGQAVDAPVVGSRVITVTPGATAGGENIYAEGYLVIVNDTGDIANAGTTYKVAGHPAIVASTAFEVTIVDTFWEAVAAASTVALVKHPCRDVVINPAANAAALVGIPLRDIPLDNFGWFQTKGTCGCLQDGALVNGDVIAVSDGVAGAVQPITATQAIDEVEIGEAISNTATGDVAVINLRLS